MTVKNSAEEARFWENRYVAGETGWDIGAPSAPLTAYFDQLSNRHLEILIPGAGNAHEAAYLHQRGFDQVTVLDISAVPLEDFARRNPDFLAKHLVHANFFEHQGQYDLIVEQTFFCSFTPLAENRALYARHCAELLRPGGKLVGLWFCFPLTDDLEKRPFGGSKAEYLSYFEPYFEVKTLEICHNSIKPRAGNELFGILIRR